MDKPPDVALSEGKHICAPLELKLNEMDATSKGPAVRAFDLNHHPERLAIAKWTDVLPSKSLDAGMQPFLNFSVR